MNKTLFGANVCMWGAGPDQAGGAEVGTPWSRNGQGPDLKSVHKDSSAKAVTVAAAGMPPRAFIPSLLSPAPVSFQTGDVRGEAKAAWRGESFRAPSRPWQKRPDGQMVVRTVTDAQKRRAAISAAERGDQDPHRCKNRQTIYSLARQPASA